MTGFAAIPDAIRAAGKATADAVGTLRQADCGTPVAELADAMPGGATSGAAGSYAQSWTTALNQWCDQAGQHATNLSQVAANYGSTEDANTHNLEPYGSGSYNIQSVNQHGDTTGGSH